LLGTGGVQICQNVNVYGFDPPDVLPFPEDRPYRYYDTVKPERMDVLVS
jgi:hypothetical protein